MPKKPRKDIYLTPDVQLIVNLTLAHSCLMDGEPPDFALSPVYRFDLEPAERRTWREEREKEARRGNVTALADLIRLSSWYLACPLTICTIEVLRAELIHAKTIDERERAGAALDCLTRALRGREDLRGSRPHAPARDVANLYGLLLPLYQAAHKGVRVKDVVPYRTVRETREAITKHQAPPSALVLLEAVMKDHDFIELPPTFYRYLNGQATLPEGIEKHPAPIRLRSGGQPVELPPCYRFKVPKEDLDLIQKPEDRRSRSLLEKDVKAVVMTRVACILNIAGSADHDWLMRLIRKGKQTD